MSGTESEREKHDFDKVFKESAEEQSKESEISPATTAASPVK